MSKHHLKPGSPGYILEHYGVKGMHWGEVHEDPLVGRSPAKPLRPGTPEFDKMMRQVTRTDHPQFVTPNSSGKIQIQTQEQKRGLTKNQKMMIAFGATTAAAAGYVAYKHYTGQQMPGLDIRKLAEKEKLLADSQLAGMKVPAKWDVSGLKHGPISKQALGDLAGGEINLKFKNAENLVVNTSRGYADFLPKDGFSNPYAGEQHASVIRVLEDMRAKYPSIRNMNIEVVPMSHVPGLEGIDAHMSVMSMRAGEARVIYNDLMDKPSAMVIQANRKFLPGLAAKDYVAQHEMGHLLAVAHGELPASFDIASGNAGPAAMRTWQKADGAFHRRTFAKHGFSFKELSKLSQYAATEPAEAMAELAGHYFNPEMRTRLTPDQVSRAKKMFDEMGGLT